MPAEAERSVLHVLPHPGGGGERYVDLVAEMPGYRFERRYLASSPNPGVHEVVRGLAAVARVARRHHLLHVHGEVAAGLCLLLLAMRPSVVTLHGLHLVRRVSGACEPAARLNLRAILCAADHTICVSESEREQLIDAVGARAARRAIVIRNGVHVPPPTSPNERDSVRRSLGIPSSDPLAIWIGSLDDRKDPLAAIRAAEESRVRLLVVGDGPLRADVERRTGGYARALGHRDDVQRLLAAADMYVSTSRREGLSLSLLEAMAHGLVPIVTDLPENLEVIDGAGLAIRAGEDSLGSALRHLAENASERARIGERAFRRVAELFSAGEMVRRTREVYDHILEERHESSRSTAF